MRFIFKILFFFLLLFPFISEAKAPDFLEGLSIETPKKDSLIVEYYPSGNIRIKGKRYDGIWNGIVTEYYDVGIRENNIYKKTRYKKGAFKWEKEFNKNGKLIKYTTPKKTIKKADCGC